MNTRLPNWKKWRAVPSVKLWEGIALSLGIEPAKVRKTQDFIEGEHPINEGAEFNDRLFVASRNSESLHYTALSLIGPHESSVLLRPFAVWAKSLGWRVPDEFAAIASEAARTATAIALEADYAEWSKRELWTIVEAACLLCGLKPFLATQIDRNAGKAHECYRDLKDATTLKGVESFESRTGSVGGTLVRPRDCIAWARKRGYRIPEELEGLTLTPNDKPLHPKERETLLKLVIGTAIKGFDYDPSASRSDVPKQIAAGLESLGIGLDLDTVRKWLREAAELLPQRPRKR